MIAMIFEEFLRFRAWSEYFRKRVSFQLYLSYVL